MGKRWDVDKGDQFLVLDKNGTLIRGVCWADEDAQTFAQIYVYSINLPLAGGKRTAKCAVREGHGPFTVVSWDGVFTRAQLLTKLARSNGWTHGAEVGVAKGSTSFYLLEHNPKLHMTFVDSWPGNFNRFVQKFKQGARKFSPERFTLIEKPSVEGAELVPDESLDFVFIDADHTQESCTADIIAWLPKVKPTGMILGHDATWDGVEKAYQATLKNVTVWHPDAVWMANKADQVGDNG